MVPWYMLQIFCGIDLRLPFSLEAHVHSVGFKRYCVGTTFTFAFNHNPRKHDNKHTRV